MNSPTLRSPLKLLSAVLLFTVVGCSNGSDKSSNPSNVASDAAGLNSSSAVSSSSATVVSSSSATSSAAPVALAEPAPNAQWKRGKTMQSDLGWALDLSPQLLCNEVGSLPCFDQVHLSALGGNEPFVITQYEPVTEPSVISAVAAERVALAACSNKVASDTEGAATIFTDLDLSAMSAPDDSDYLNALDQQNRKLYQRLLARDPSDPELQALHALATDEANQAISNADVAKLSCFVIATSSEFTFL